MNIIEHFQRVHLSDVQASARAVESLESVPDSSRGTPEYSRGLGVMAHVHIARRVWHERLHGRVLKPADWFAPWPTATTRAEAAAVDQIWAAYLAALTESDLLREVRYETSDGSKFSSVVGDIVTNVFNHSTYHRGQIARIVTECGGTRATTDYIAFHRKPV
jgi:uncharacterized damage-inducible protein DinB